MIILSATDTNAVRAAKKVNVYAETYQTERLTALIADLTKSKTVIQQQIDDFQKAGRRGQQANRRPRRPRSSTHPITDPTYDGLIRSRQQLDQSTEAKRSELQGQLNEYQQRLQILQLSERLTTTGGGPDPQPGHATHCSDLTKPRA